MGTSRKDDIESIRREYDRAELLEDNVASDPMDQFSEWFSQALETEFMEVNAMTLSTSGKDGKPSSRIVLLKGVEKDGFRFFTNYGSRKGQELEENPHAALCFFWPVLERQVRIEGQVFKLSREESQAYFEQRPRQSKLGAWASYQSQTVESRQELEENFTKMENRFDNQEIPTPEFWGGYILKPSSVEFWQGRQGRLHDRLKYFRADDQWNIKRLSP
ncbi:MAG: pyridoxamine 5'-phosphate oxidase [Balneolaceae bacterium]|nr:pyridoxamine 5'-phosphate oxidase [Balneolaceae bacterium]